MAENKKSFVLYTDIIHVFSNLTDDEAGKLIKHLLAYVNDENPQTDNRIIQIAFEPIKLQLKRDLKHWESVINKRKDAGKLGGLAKASKSKQTLANLAVNDTVNVTVNVNDINNNNIEQRKLKFSESLKPFLESYGKDMLNEFYLYWTEPNKSNTKFRKELQITWDTKRRLEKWSKNGFGNNKNIINKENLSLQEREEYMRNIGKM